MAAVPLRLLLLVLFLIPSPIRSDTELHSDGVHSALPKTEFDPALLLELQNVRSQYQDLEESSLEKDLVIHDKEKIISALRVELEGLKKEESLQYDSALNELDSKVAQLEDDLKRTELELQESRSKAKTLEDAQSLHASKIKELEKVVSEQKKQIRKAEKALRAAEATLLRVQQEADAKDNELRKLAIVLQQDGYAVAYESRVLTKAKKVLQIYEKELLAVIHALSSWKYHLLRADFTIHMDHQFANKKVKLFTDFIGKKSDESIELCTAWGRYKTRGRSFFDNGAKANYISLDLATRLGVKLEEMGPQLDASLAAPGHEVAVTPLISKL
ncbi:hypothetical protein L7F22_002619 [Adiantum nelumboides]|nr:hypothetical protein [Adiantum nelumboides]